jgi:IS5 family transposase
MRKNREIQLPITPPWPDHRLGDELRMASQILDDNPEILHSVLQDLSDKVDPENGSPGLSAEQVLRCAVLKNWHGLSYQRLAFHLSDSMSFRAFCRLPLAWSPSKSCLQENISRIRAATWEGANQGLVGWAREERLETGRKIRGDATAVESNILHPTDSQLLYDSIRTLTAGLRALQKIHPEVVFSDHCRRAKRRCTNIRNARGKDRKKPLYEDLLKVAGQTAGYVRTALEKETDWNDPKSLKILGKLRHHLQLMEKVMDQTERRVVRGQTVPAPEKIVSIFEEHTDIIETGRRETTFGHKVYLSCGKTSLILDCRVLEGNPADQTQMKPMLERHFETYGSYPRQVSIDGGFASQENLGWAKQQGILDVAFAKKGKLKVSEMVRSSWIYRQLRRFRAGIEGCISMLKRVFGVRRCTWKGWDHFQQFVHLSVVGFNLLVLARLLL